MSKLEERTRTIPVVNEHGAVVFGEIALATGSGRTAKKCGVVTSKETMAWVLEWAQLGVGEMVKSFIEDDGDDIEAVRVATLLAASVELNKLAEQLPAKGVSRAPSPGPMPMM